MRRLLLILAVVLAATPASAEPTPVNRFVEWDYSGKADGFYLYLAPETESPRVYSDARRVQIADPAARSVVLVDVYAQATEGVCVKMTAYRGTWESGFSNEACGFFGLGAPANLRIR
ncbi:MAG TPA: hypothetical protein VF406_04185 [Thermodesulfobacteriota bacterium]